MKNLKKIWFAAVIIAMVPLLSACGGGGNRTPTQNKPLYNVGGAVTGLSGTVYIQNNYGTPVPISANVPFAFTGYTDGAAYNITVYNHPARQTCTVQNGSGTIRSANVTNVRIACENNGETLSGRIAVPPGVAINSSNDPNDDYGSNESFESPIILPNPITVGGYVNQPRYGSPGQLNNFRTELGRNGNPNDYYEVQLKKDDVITLAIGESDTRANNLDLYLYDSSRKQVDESLGDGAYEMVGPAPSDGTYYVKVSAKSGASNYILTIGADTATAEIAAADPGILSTRHEMVPDQVIVRFKDTIKTAGSINQTFTQYAANMGLTSVAGTPDRGMLFNIDGRKFQINTNETESANAKSLALNADDDPEKTRRLNTLLAILELRKQPDILSAEPNYIVRSYSTVPDDTHYGYQWNLPMINLPEAWDHNKGSDDVIVAVVDSGVLLEHPDLKGRLITGYNFVRDKSIGPDGNDPGDKENVKDRSSFHGTHVAGIIAAKTDNNLGVAGVTWYTKIMPVRVIGAGGSGTIYDLEQGIRYAAGLDNDYNVKPARHADIINLSLGSSARRESDQRLFNEIRAKGIIVIAAAGNEKTSRFSYPASYDGVISVSAVDINGSRASYSNYGSRISVAAPGGDSGDFNGNGYQDYILSTGGNDSSGSVVYEYTFKAGTSMAAPHVAGVAALMKAAHPGLSPVKFDELLEAGEITDSAGGGRNDDFGYGLINAFKAVAAASKLAGGGEIEGLYANPMTVNFGAALMEATVTVTGTGGLSVTGANPNADWLTVARNSVNSNGSVNYTLNVNRSSSSLSRPGIYTAVVTFTAGSKSVSVSVSVQVHAPSEITHDAGYHYVLLLSVNVDDDGAITINPDIVDQYDVKSSGGYYDYVFNNVPPGKYMIAAGSDRNNNLVINDGGESFGAYPNVDQMVVIDTTEGGKSDLDFTTLDFTTNLILSISNNSVTVADKPSTVPPAEFKRLR